MILNMQKENSKRLYYIDNLRICLSLLVVAHHWALANGGPGNWYTGENNLGEFRTLILSQFVAVNQAFFMGFFFLISGYLYPGHMIVMAGKSFAGKGESDWVSPSYFTISSFRH